MIVNFGDCPDASGNGLDNVSTWGSVCTFWDYWMRMISLACSCRAGMICDKARLERRQSLKAEVVEFGFDI